MNRGTLLVLGLLIGAAIGWFTVPKPAVDIQVGGLSIQVQGERGGGAVTARDGAGSMEVAVGDRSASVLADPLWRTLIFAAIGGAVGLVISAVAGRRTA